MYLLDYTTEPIILEPKRYTYLSGGLYKKMKTKKRNGTLKVTRARGRPLWFPRQSRYSSPRTHERACVFPRQIPLKMVSLRSFERLKPPRGRW